MLGALLEDCVGCSVRGLCWVCVLGFVGLEMEDLESLVVKLRKKLEEAAQGDLQVSTK